MESEQVGAHFSLSDRILGSLCLEDVLLVMFCLKVVFSSFSFS